jgi:OOP family OmpA-OmpF porin
MWRSFLPKGANVKMKRFAVGAAAAAVAAALSAPALAQTSSSSTNWLDPTGARYSGYTYGPYNNPTWYGIINGTMTIPDGGWQTDNGPGWGAGGRLGVPIAPNWDLQIMGNWSRSSKGGNDADQTLVGVDVLYLFNRSQLRPFLVFGGGGEYDSIKGTRNNVGYSESGWAPYLNAGLGLQYYFTDQWFTQVDARYKYSWISDKFFFDTAGDWYFNLGIGYHFGKPPAPPAPRVAPPPPAPVVVPPAPKPPPPPPPPPQPVTRKFDLSADALFAFGSSTLTADGKRRIDEVRTALQQAGIAGGDILITGHTDPIGSEAYNQKLSERRAEAVAAYLKSTGSTATIRTAGAGESQLRITEADCKAKGQARTRAALIACLAPDRRVEITGTGIVKQ